MALTGAILLIVNNCSEEVVEIKEVPQKVVSKKFPDLSLAIQKRVEKKPEEAIQGRKENAIRISNDSKVVTRSGRVSKDVVH